MKLLDRIDRIQAQAVRLKAESEAVTARNAIEKRLGSQVQRKAAILSAGFLFNPEGAETHYSGAHRVSVPSRLPSKEVGWDLNSSMTAPASVTKGDAASTPERTAIRYRVLVEVESPGSISAYTGQTTAQGGGALLMKDRTIQDRAVLDFQSGSVRLVSTSYITRISVFRYTERIEGELILGPFNFNGVVSAKTIGFGNFTTTVASDYIYNSVSATSWKAETYGTPLTQRVEGSPWSLQRLTDRTIAEPVFGPTVHAGRTAEPSTDVKIEVPTAYDGAVYWAGLGDWVVYGASDAPEFEPIPSYYTYVWGSITAREGAGRVTAFDLTTGRPADPTRDGYYIVRCQDPSFVTINGANSSYGEPMRFTSDAGAQDQVARHYDLHGAVIIPPGIYKRTVAHEAPEGVLVKVRGSGTLKAIEFTIVSTSHSPVGHVLTKKFRVDLSQYWSASDSPSRGAVTTGRGQFVSA